MNRISSLSSAVAELPWAVMPLDLRMPSLSGATNLEHLRERDIQLPVIAISADLRATEALTDSILKCLSCSVISLSTLQIGSASDTKIAYRW
jgi:CheY-like chemotaxis protein